MQQNQQLAKLQDEYGSEGLQSVCITCDPAHDTPEALAAYASRFGAKPETWHFLTGDVKQIKDVGSRMFRVSVDEQMHSDRLMLVGRDGKVVGTYRSSEPEQLAALRVELKKQLDDDSGHVAQGSSAVNGDGADPTQLPVAFFTLTDQLGQDFDTKKLEGQYWLASFFFTRCPSICRALNQEVAKVQAAYADRGLQIVSITCDPAHDTPSVLLNYGKLFNARPESWHFLTGAFPEIKQIANEHFGKMLEEEVHSDRLFVIGPDGHIVESFRSTQADQVQALHAKLAELLTPAGQ